MLYTQNSPMKKLYKTNKKKNSTLEHPIEVVRTQEVLENKNNTNDDNEYTKLIEISKLLDDNTNFCINESEYQNILNILLNTQIDEIKVDTRIVDVKSLLYDIIKKFSMCKNIIKDTIEFDNKTQVILNGQVTDADIDNMLNIDKIIELYDKIISLKEYFMSQSFADIHNNGNILNEKHLSVFYTLRYVKSDDIYISSSPDGKKLKHKFNGKLSDNIRTFITARQFDIFDKVYNNDPDILIKSIVKQNNENHSFATLYYLEYNLKRIIQNGITELTLNYTISHNKSANLFTVTKNNELYSRFILRNVKSIKHYINEKIGDAKVIDTININEQAKEYFKINKPSVEIISKGGNLIKMISSPLVEKEEYIYKLSDYTDYFTQLSDWDFDCKLKLFDPLQKINMVEHHNICDDDYGFLKQQIKNKIVELICEYFKNMKTIYSEHYGIEDYTYNENSIKNHILYVNHLFRAKHTTLALNIMSKHVDIKFKDTRIDKLLCEIESDKSQNILKNAFPESNVHDGIFSYISQKFIGDSFDLTRLCIRMEIPGCLLTSKAECIDIGLSIPYIKDYNTVSDDAIYTWIIRADVFEFKGKSLLYLINELCYIIFSDNNKRYKRIERIFKLFEFAIKTNDSIFELMNTSFKYLENRFTDFRYNINILDAIIFMFIEFHKVLDINKVELSKTSIFIEFKNMYNSFIDVINSNNQTKMNTKLIFKYSPNGSKPFPFKSWLTYTNIKDILDKYYPGIVLNNL